MVPRLALTFTLAAFVCATAARAQTPQTDSDLVAPAHVAHVDGTVSLEREGRTDNSPLNMPLLSGDRLRTVDGRVEVLFADGSTLHLDNRSTIDVQSDDLVRLTDGRLRLNILGPARMVAYRIDSPAGSARITQPGEYRIALLRNTSDTQLEVAVVRGAAEIFTDEGATPIRAGERAYASAGLAPSYAYSFNSANWDAFDRWSEARRDGRLGVSSQYLPADMQAYAPLLDEGGDWRYTQSYGYAWYPRVAADWRPYYYGRWASYPRYGWTWIGADRFAWPTHHYGRWGFSSGTWFWIPSSRWAPAYVSWAYAPGYVSWCPLGFDNRPIFAIDVYRTGPGYYSPWRGWTAVSYTHFGGRDFYVNQRAVNWDRFDRGQRPRFETRSSAPGFSRDVAVPRNSTPIHSAGSRGVLVPSPNRASSRDGSGLPPSGGREAASPRTNAAPRYVNRGDEIIRSQTERPSAPNRAIDRGGEARTMPEGPARQAQPDVDRRPVDPSRASASPRAEPRGDGAQGRTYQPRAYEPYDPAQGRRARPAGEPAYPAGSAPAREPGPRAYERPRPSAEPQPAPQRQPERRAAPERAAPQERAAPREAPPARGGGVAVPRRGGRGGS